MKTASIPTLQEVRGRHDQLVARLREERQQSGSDSPVAIPPELAAEIDGFTHQIQEVGSRLYNDTDRSAALSLMSYWINSLYRAEYYQGRGEEPPPPVLAHFSPESQPALTDDDYPWPRCDRPLEAAEMSSLWQRLSEQGLKILTARKLLGVTGASGCGRSNLIDTALLPKFRESCGAGVREHVISPADGLGGDGILKTSADEDLPFLGALAAVARSGSPPDRAAPGVAELARDPAALARVLDASGERHLLVVHDLHQLFVRSDDSFDLEPSVGQRAFMAALTQVAASPVGHRLIVDVQTEYLARLRDFPDFIQLLDRPIGESATDGWLIVSLENDELRKFLVEPAERIGLHFEAGLVDRIVFEHQGEAAAATIMLFTLRRLWLDMLAHQDAPGERRNMIAWQNYRRVGSGRLVIEIAADEATQAVLDGEDSEDEKTQALDAIRQVFIELVRIMPGTAWWLPRVPRESIATMLAKAGHPAGRIERVLSEFTRVGLLVETTTPAGVVTLRIFHDAVVGRWTRMIQWLETERSAQRLRWVLRADARDWNQLLSPSPTVGKIGRFQRWSDALRRLERRQSLLWRGAKLREGGQFPHLSNREIRFLAHSRRVWRATMTTSILAIAAVPILIILLLLSYQHQQRKILATQYMNRGVSLIARGDPGLEGGLWLTAALEQNVNAPEKRVIDWVPQALKPDSMLVSEMAHNLSLGMAFRRMPTLHHLTTVPDGMVEVEISPSGRFAMLGCRKQGETPGQATLWDLGGNPEILVRPEEDVSIEQVAFARRTGDSGDTWVAAGGSVGSNEKGVVFVWDLRDPGRSRVRIDTAVRVRDLAFGPASADGTRQWLAVATGEEMSLPARGQAEVYEISGAPGTLTVGQPRKLVPHPAADTWKSAPAADGRKSAISDLPATRLAFSQLGKLAVSYLDPVAGSSHLAVFEMHGDETWSGAAIFEDRLMFTDLAFSQDPHENLALATAKAGHGDGSVRVFHPGQSGWREPNPPLSLRAGILRVAFNPLGGSLAAAAANGFLGVWSIDSTGLVKLKREIAGDGWPFSIAWSPDGRWLAVGNRDRHARVWDVTSGRLVLPPLYHGATVANIAFTPDGLRLLASTLQTARLWGTAPREFSLLPVRAVERAQFTQLSGDGRHVAVASRLSGQARDGVPITELAVWRDERLVPANRYPGLPPLAKISLSDDGLLVAALTEPQPREENPQEALVWNNISGQRWTIPVHSGADFLALLPGPVPRLLVAGVTAPGATQLSAGTSKVGFLQLFDLTLKIPVAEVVALDFRVKALAATADGKRVVVGGDGGASPRGGFIATLDPAGGVSPANTLNRHAEAVTALALSKDGRLLLSGSIDDTVKLLAIAEDGRIRVLHEQKSSDERKHTADVVSVNFSHDGTRAVSTGRDFAAILYDVTGGRLQPLVVMEQRGAISHQAFSEDDQWLATGGEDGVSVWYVGPKHSLWQGKRMAALFHRYPVMGVAFTSTGELRTLALERSPDSANSSQVEAYRWKVEPVKARFSETRNNAELLAGRKLAGVPPAPVNLRSDELEARWHHSTLQEGDHPDPARELLNQALAAATAGSWRAAAMHLRALRTRDPEFFQASPDILMFAAEMFESARDPANVLATTELLLPRIASQPERRLYLEKRGIACLQLASIPQAADRDKLLDQAEADFKTLAAGESGKWWWSVREAEVHVLREDWKRALESLEQSKRQLAAASGNTGELGKDAASVSQNQRIASIYLMQAAQARRQSAAALASQAEQEWAALVRATLEQFRDAKPTAKASAAWPAVLGEAGVPEDVETACAFAEEGFRERPTYTRANTHALALLRAGRLDAAEKRLDEAISLYERERQKSERWPSDRKLDREGRPADWIVRALLLAARGASDSDAARRSLTLEKARKDLQDAREALDQPAMENLTEWRATWNFLDLRVLVAEAERKLAQISHSP